MTFQLRHLLFAALLGLLLGALAVHAVHAASRSASAPIVWAPVQIEAPPMDGSRSDATEARHVDDVDPVAPGPRGRLGGASPSPAVILDPAAPTTAVSRPAVAPTTAPIVVLRPTPRPKVAGSVSGTATWYDYVPGGAAAGAALRNAMGPNWRGKYVVVCATSCITVKLSDWMANPNAVIDLDDASFAALAPLSAGVVSVRVSW